MRRGIFTICSILLVLVVSLAVLFPGCDGGGQGTIVVKATYFNATCYGEEWEGDLTYRLTCDGEDDIYGYTVPASHTVAPGNWTCEFISGGPEWADGLSLFNGYGGPYVVPQWQEVISRIKFPFEIIFQLQRDAGIMFDTWTIDGGSIQSDNYTVEPCQVIDVHFLQWVLGCQVCGKVAVNETSWLNITQTEGPDQATVYVINDWCAVNKTFEWEDLTWHPPPPEKMNQVCSFNGTPVNKGKNITLALLDPTLLDVVTTWELVPCINYTKSINWLGISKAPFNVEQGHDCVLFELVLPVAGNYTFTLQASAELQLVLPLWDSHQQDNKATSTPLTLIVNVP